MNRPILLTALYVSGDRPDRFAKAAASGADVLILDLEDSVAPSRKRHAREAVTSWLSAHDLSEPGETSLPLGVQVRVNALDTPWGVSDLAMLRRLGSVPELRIPKVRSPADLNAYVEQLGDVGAALHVIIESAAGLESAGQIVTHPAVRTVGLGEADLAADLGTIGEEAITWARSRLVVAARAAGLPAPMQSVYPHFQDDDGLDRSCRAGRALGLLGRAAIHPRQLPVIVRAFRPSAAEVLWALDTVNAAEKAAEQGWGVAVLAGSEMVDAAMVPRAQRLLAVERAAQRTLAATATDCP